jgi:hypothetical protein
MLYSADPYAPPLKGPGFGATVPAGIEAILDYNGLWLNVQKDYERYHVTSIDGLFDADVRDTRDSNSDDDGEQTLNSFYGGRTLVMAGQIQAHGVKRMRQMQENLRTAFADTKREKPLRFRMVDSDLDHFIMVKKIAPISGIEQQVNLKAWRDFQITLRASNPRFLSQALQLIDSGDLVPTTGAPRLLFRAHNIGNFSADTILRVYGPVSNVKIINAERLTFATFSDIPDGDYFDYDSASGTLMNGIGGNRWNHLGDDSGYLRLAKGINNFYYIGDAAKVSMTWRHSWI